MYSRVSVVEVSVKKKSGKRQTMEDEKEEVQDLEHHRIIYRVSTWLMQLITYLRKTITRLSLR